MQPLADAPRYSLCIASRQSDAATWRVLLWMASVNTPEGVWDRQGTRP